MKKYLVQKIGNNTYEDTILIADVVRMKKDALLPINRCENYIINKGETVVYINGVFVNTKKRIQYEFLIFNTFEEAKEKYIELRERKKKEAIEKEIKRIEKDSGGKIKKLLDLEKLIL